MTILFKDASNLTDPNPVDATHVENYLLGNYPPSALSWVKLARWIGPVNIPHDRIDYDDEGKWSAAKQPGVVSRFARKIKRGTGHTNPVIMVQVPGDDRAKVVDGHHRTLAYRELHRPVKAYVGFVPRGDDRWRETHSSQTHSGADPKNKNEVCVGGIRKAYKGVVVPDLAKAVVKESVTPVLKQLDALGKRLEKNRRTLDNQLAALEAGERELAEWRCRWNALAFEPPKNAETVVKQRTQDANERVQGMMIRQLQRVWRTSENPKEREAAYTAMMKYRGMIDDV